MLISMYADVILPLRIRPLTYRIPDSAGSDIKGRIVSVPLMNKTHYGLATNVFGEIEEDLSGVNRSNIKDIISVHERFASDSYLKFLQWISAYYLAHQGVILKSSFFEEAAAGLPQADRLRRRKKTNHSKEMFQQTAADVPIDLVGDIVKSATRGAFSALLYHAPDIESEFSLALRAIEEIAKEKNGVILLVPEIADTEKIASELNAKFGDRLILLHNKLSKNEKRFAIHNILAGKADIIVGTRSAILAPLPASKFIVVVEEHSSCYKAEEGARYNARDLAVRRAFMNQACVLLMSICPSLESYYNHLKGKYRILNGHLNAKRPRIRIVTHRTTGKNPSALSRTAVNEAVSALKNNSQALFLSGRKGYSLIRCEECGYIEVCDRCETPMIFYKNPSILKCHHCRAVKTAPETCQECGAAKLSPFTFGEDRLKEELESVLRRIPMSSESALIYQRGKESDENSFLTPYIVGAALKKTGLEYKKYNSAILMNIDLLLARPDFRAHERAFQTAIETSQFVKPEGSIIIQTRARGSKFLKILKDYDFRSFYDMELIQRREIGYPPFQRLILISITAKDARALQALNSNSYLLDGDKNVQILGPMEISVSSKLPLRCYNLILKSADQKKLRQKAAEIVAFLEKNRRMKINVDVDPLKI